MISVVIPTYNEEQCLPKLLESLKCQSYKDFEIIVADNNSIDKTRELAKKAGVKIVNGGLPSRGRNCGAKVASGDWLLFLDADVILSPNFLEEACAEIEKRQLAVASCLVKPMSNKKIDYILHGIVNNYMKLMKNISTHAPGSCIFVKTWVHKNLEGFNEKLKLAEDHDYVNRARKIANFGLLKKVRVPISVRRLEKDGRFNIAMKYLAIEAHLIFLGPIYSDVFNYKFGYSSKK